MDTRKTRHEKTLDFIRYQEEAPLDHLAILELMAEQLLDLRERRERVDEELRRVEDLLGHTEEQLKNYVASRKPGVDWGGRFPWHRVETSKYRIEVCYTGMDGGTSSEVYVKKIGEERQD